MTSFDPTRRHFVGGLAAGAALAATGARAAPGAARNRKMIVRADDVGHSPVCNIGTFEAVDHGVVTAVDVMFDSPGTEDALHRLRRYPWLSVGWHMHMWGAPVLGAKEVPSLVEHGGEFDGRFRTDLLRAGDINAEEALRELRAQMLRCKRILGRVPDTGGKEKAPTVWGRVLNQVVREFGLAENFSASPPVDPAFYARIAAAQAQGEQWAKFYSVRPPAPYQPAPQWADRRIIEAASIQAYAGLNTDSVVEVEANYDPVRFYTEDRAHILEYPLDVITWQAWHPGYVDYYVYRLGERVNRARAQQFVVGRTQDVAALTSPVLRAWIKANRIELVSFRDALFGRNDYQNHLRAIDSDLAR